MKLGIIHLSDFHVHENETFLPEKIAKFLVSLNVLGEVDEYVIVFSGDLAASGKANEYKKSRYIIGQILQGVKKKCDGRFVHLLMVPGNHDLSLHQESRTRENIQEAYNNNSIEMSLPYEFTLLDNYYTLSHANARIPYDKILDRRFCTFGDEFKIQFNLVNTAPFSTLKPNDKELHYFPKDKMIFLKKQTDVNICITVMHHTCEWFNWQYQSDLERTIINNSEFLFTGHDHSEKTKEVSIDSSMDTWISCAGEMKFSNISYRDSFNALLIDTELNTFCGYIFTWNSKERLFVHSMPADNKALQRRSTRLTPLPSFLKDLKEDAYNSSEDFTRYFVFPKLTYEHKNEYGKRENVSSVEEFTDFIDANKRILVSGSSNSGKSMLLKYLYCTIFATKTPLFVSIDSTTKIRLPKLIKRLFEEQYGDDPVLFERYQQLGKDSTILIIDGIDSLGDSKGRASLMTMIRENYDYIVLSSSSVQQSIIDSVKDKIDNNQAFHELRIKPFFAEKRNQLVRNICTLTTSYNDEDIANINRLIDKLVRNNSKLFSLDPAFIIKYTDYFIKSQSYDYAQSEAVFSKVFEHGIQSSIIAFTKKADVDEMMTAFEELSGYIYSSRKDLLKIEEFCDVIARYNDEYSVKVSADSVLEIGIRSKILKKTDDLSIYFSNKNYLAYFIAKYLLRISQGPDSDYSGIEYALRNICFGINADIILFISYLSSNTRIVMSIATEAGTLLSPWEELSFDSYNIRMLRISKQEQVDVPTAEEHDNLKTEKEYAEESQYSDEVIEAKGLFEYDETDIDRFPFRLDRAMEYTAILCKALPAFNSMLKKSQKEGLIDAIYSYPHKIAFALLKPLDERFDTLCNELFEFSKMVSAEKKAGKPYTREDIANMVVMHARALVLGVYDHFAELCTSPKTIALLNEKETNGINQWIEKLMIKENSGSTEDFLREAELMLKSLKDEQVKHIIKLIARKHLLCNPDLQHNKKQQIVDRIMGKSARKAMLLLPK